MHDVHLRLGPIAEVRVANVRVPIQGVALLGEVEQPPFLLLRVVHVRVVGDDGDELDLFAVLRGVLDVLRLEGHRLLGSWIRLAVVITRVVIGAFVGRLDGRRVLSRVIPVASSIRVVVLAVAAVRRGERSVPPRVVPRERTSASSQMMPGAAQPGSRARDQPAQRAHRFRSMPPPRSLWVKRDARAWTCVLEPRDPDPRALLL